MTTPWVGKIHWDEGGRHSPCGLEGGHFKLHRTVNPSRVTCRSCRICLGMEKPWSRRPAAGAEHVEAEHPDHGEETP